MDESVCRSRRQPNRSSPTDGCHGFWLCEISDELELTSDCKDWRPELVRDVANKAELRLIRLENLLLEQARDEHAADISHEPLIGRFVLKMRRLRADHDAERRHAFVVEQRSRNDGGCVVREKSGQSRRDSATIATFLPNGPRERDLFRLQESRKVSER